MASGCLCSSEQTVLITYRRSGGIAGVNDELVIYSNHQAILVRRTGRAEFTLDADQVARLVQQFEEANFVSLDREYLPQNTCCDLYEYVVTYEGHTVRTMDTAIPEPLEPLLRTLNEIIQSNQGAVQK